MSDIPVVICTVCSNQMIDNRHLIAENAQLRKRVEAMERVIRDEPEFPGSMPDEMWEIISRDRDACEQSHRLAVKHTKANILKALEDVDGAAS